MELFHQTVSMKSVGNLTDFVRDHMLEPFDAAKAVSDIVAHFDDLTKAHDAVRRAEAQLAALTPLLKDCDAPRRRPGGDRGARLPSGTALRYYFADLKAELLDRPRTRPRSRQSGRGCAPSATISTAALGRPARAGDDLRVELAGHGGNRLAEIERQLADCDGARDARLGRAERFAGPAGRRGPEPGGDRASSSLPGAARSRPPGTPPGRISPISQNALTETRRAPRRCSDEAAEVNAELRSLRERKTNIPKKQLDLRAAVPRVGLGEDVAAVRRRADRGARQRGRLGGRRGAAAARLRPVGAGSRRALPGRIRLDQRPPPERTGWSTTACPASRRPARASPSSAPGTLAAKLEVKDTPFAGWLEHELASRADHECVETMAEFRRMPRAITKAGQIKGSGGRHEKDDRCRIDDRSRYVLGWSNQRKLDALLRPGAAAGRPPQRGRGRAAAAQEGAGRRDRAGPGAGRAGPDARVRRDRLAVRGQPGRGTRRPSSASSRPPLPNWPG